MGRPIPINNERRLGHHPLSLQVVLACMVAVIAIVVVMCGSRSRKKRKSKRGENNTSSPTPSPPNRQEILGSSTKDDVITTKTTELATVLRDEGEEVNKPLPPPPASIAIHRVPLDHKRKKPNIDKSSSLHNYISSNASRRRRLSTGSISMWMPIARSIKHKERGGEEDSIKNTSTRWIQEESLWTRKILLGEKCRLHEEDEEEDECRLNDEATFSYGANEEPKWVCSLPRVDENDNEDMSSGSSSFEEDSSLNSSLDEWISKEMEAIRAQIK